MKYDDVAAVDAKHLVAAGRDVRGSRDDVACHGISPVKLLKAVIAAKSSAMARS
jgi:hypothetical protein